MRVPIWVILLALCAAPLAAESTVEMKVALIGHIYESGGVVVEGASIKSEANELWGFATKRETERQEKVHGAYPKVTVTGSAQSEDDGGFVIELAITLKGDRIPKMKVPKQDGTQGDVSWCNIDFLVEKKGYVPVRVTMTVFEGTTNEIRATVSKAAQFKGRALNSETRAPIAGLTLGLGEPYSYFNDANRGARKTTLTDAKGYFSFDSVRSEDLRNGRIVADSEAWSLDPESALWNGLPAMVGGVCDAGEVLFSAAGTVSLACVNADGQPVNVDLRLMREPASQRFIERKQIADGNKFSYLGVPNGKYTLVGSAQDMLPLRVGDIVVAGGKSVDLGNVVLYRPLTVVVTVQTTDGKSVGRGTLSARQLEGTDPYDRDTSGAPHQSVRSQDYSGNEGKKNVTLSNMPPGKWQFTLTSEGHCPATATLQLSTKNETLTLTLKAGGTLKLEAYEIDGRACSALVFVVGIDTPAYKELAETGKLESARKNERSGRRAESVLTGYASENRDSALRNVAPGKYGAIGYVNERDAIRVDDFEVSEGLEITLTFKVPVATLKAVFKRGDKLLTNSAVVAVPAELLPFLKDKPAETESTPPFYRNRPLNISNAVTDNEGCAVFSAIEVTPCYVMTKREYNFVARNWAMPGAAKLIRNLRTRVLVLVGGQNNCKVDLPELDGTWLNVKFRSEASISFDFGELYRVPYDGLRYFGTPDESRNLEFGPVPQGQYDLVAQANRQQFRIARRIEVGAEGELSLTLDAYPRRATIKVAAPAEELSRVRVYFRPMCECMLPLSKGGEGVWARLNGESFEASVIQGRYLCVASCDDTSILPWVVSKEVEIGKDPVEVKLDKPSGKGAIRFKPIVLDPLLGDGSTYASYRLRLLDANNREVALPEPNMTWFSTASLDPWLASVPAGTYALVVEGGVKQARIPNVSVKADAWTELDLKLEVLYTTTFVLSGSDLDLGALLAAKLTLLDASGSKLPHQDTVGVNRPVMISPSGGTDFSVTIQNLPATTAEIRLSVEGFEDARLPFSVSVGREPRQKRIILKKT